MKSLIIFDLDGTLFDTREVNFLSYSIALKKYGFSLNHDFFCQKCNGRKYTDFLPEIIKSNDSFLLEKIHQEKKDLYSSFLDKAICNQFLFDIIESLKNKYFCSLVTTATKKNTQQILRFFGKDKCFDFIVSQEDCSFPKPNPECFLLAMSHFCVTAQQTIIFEDSDVGVMAARKATKFVYVVNGFNS